MIRSNFEFEARVCTQIVKPSSGLPVPVLHGIIYPIIMALGLQPTAFSGVRG